MISQKEISIDWINKVSKENRNVDKILVEKVIRALILYDAKAIEKFQDPLESKDWLIADPMNTKLNKFKKSNPQAFFYWYKIYELLIQAK